MPSAAEYLARVTPWHASRPRFIDTLGSTLAPVADLQVALASLVAAFDLDIAEGAQLDAIGVRVGRSRYVSAPLAGAFFSFGNATVGFGAGVWKGPFDATEGVTALDDGSYRTLLRAKIAANAWDGTLEGMAAALAQIIPGGDTTLWVMDGQDMSMTIGLSGRIPDAVTRALIRGGYVPLKPAGVSVAYRITSVDQAPCFGFGATTAAIAGFGTGAWASPL